jgi:hypothetical protein
MLLSLRKNRKQKLTQRSCSFFHGTHTGTHAPPPYIQSKRGEIKKSRFSSPSLSNLGLYLSFLLWQTHTPAAAERISADIETQRKREIDSHSISRALILSLVAIFCHTPTGNNVLVPRRKNGARLFSDGGLQGEIITRLTELIFAWIWNKNANKML